MLKIFTFWFIIMAVLRSAVSDPNDKVKVIKMVQDLNIDNSYKFSYELSDGQSRSEYGRPKQIGAEKPIISRGNYKFVAPNGQTHWVEYKADENGYRSRSGIGANVKSRPYDLSDDEDEPGSGSMPYPYWD